MAEQKTQWERAADIVKDAGGRIVGRTRLQKIAYLLQLAGVGDGFSFDYKHYGPYSEELAAAISSAEAFGLVVEEEKLTSWGGWYSIYSAGSVVRGTDIVARHALAHEAIKIGAIELELAATAAYLHAVEGCSDPWGETARLKPEKASLERMSKAKTAYEKLRKIDTPSPLPELF